MSDKYITQEIDITPTKVSEYGSLERKDAEHAKPASACGYPNCEECGEYVRYQGRSYCTVPMVINKQIWRLTADLIAELAQRLTDLETLVTDEILGRDTPEEPQTNNVLICENCKHFRYYDEDFGDCELHKRRITRGSYCTDGEFEP